MLPHERASIHERTAALPVNPPVLPLAMPHLSRPLAVLRDRSRYVPNKITKNASPAQRGPRRE